MLNCLKMSVGFKYSTVVTLSKNVAFPIYLNYGFVVAISFKDFLYQKWETTLRYTMII